MLGNKSKKIIAREGLVVLGILTFSGICFLINFTVPYEAPTALYEITIGKTVYEVDVEEPPLSTDADLAVYELFKQKSALILPDGKPLDLEKPYKAIPKAKLDQIFSDPEFIELDDSEKEKLLSAINARNESRNSSSKFDIETARPVSDLPACVEVKFIKWKYTFKGRVREQSLTIALISLFLFYPIYLLARFIIWAVKILRGK